MTTAEKLVRIAENEPKVYEAGRKEGMSFVADNVGNALKGSASGEAVALKDVSPLEHNLKVKISGVDNPEAVKILVQGANLLSLDKIIDWGNCSIENGVVTQTEADTSQIPYLKAVATFDSGEYELMGKSEAVTASGKVSFQITCARETNKLAFGFNGSVIDTMVRFDNLSLPAGTYIASCNVINATQGSISWKDMQIALVDTDYEPYKEPIEYSQSEDIKPIYPTTTIMTDTAGAVLTVEYNKDINAAFAELLQRISSLGG
jgi:hypothetical protein